jgi:hypothetical protein
MFHNVIEPLLEYTDPTIGEQILEHVDAIKTLEPELDLAFYGETCNPHAGSIKAGRRTTTEIEREQ